MSNRDNSDDLEKLYRFIAEYGSRFRRSGHPVHPKASVKELRDGFIKPLPEKGMPGDEVIRQLISAAEPGLVGNTDPNFYAWVMGASDQVGVAADWLTSLWGQNAAIFQTAPSAAIAEEAVSNWVLDLLDLPQDSAVGLVSGATMASFSGLAAARASVLARAGHDFYEHGLQAAPRVRFFISEDAHVTNFAAIRYLGFGAQDIAAIRSDESGLMIIDELAQEMARATGPQIIIAQAGHINSGGFENFSAICDLANTHQAWVHVDGAFGLWARVLAESHELTRGIERADSWSVDGHKWLQLPYECGFAIVRDSAALKKAMNLSAGYLSQDRNDGRNPSDFNPELSRRARGFAAWAVMQHLGREGITDMIHRHCDMAAKLAARLEKVDGVRIVNKVMLNQLVVTLTHPEDRATRGNLINQLADRLNKQGLFVRVVNWKGEIMLRFSIISQYTNADDINRLGDVIETTVQDLTSS